MTRSRRIGPGAMVAAAFIGPGTVTTATLAGASYGYTLLWAVLFSILGTFVLQEMAARLGLLNGSGLGEVIRKKQTGWRRVLISILVIGAILVGNAAYEAGNISGAVLGFSTHWSPAAVQVLIVLIGVVAFALLYIGNYQVIERALIVLVGVMGLVFILAAIGSRPNIGAILSGLFKPQLPDGGALLVVGLIGTTIVPYNLFLHASSVNKRWSGVKDLSPARWDAAFSIGIGGLITMAILVCSAAVLHDQGLQELGPADLSIQLEPLLGQWAGSFLGLGFLAAGVSSSVTAPLAAAFATAGILGWGSDLKSFRFKMVWIFVLGIGVLFASLGFKPLHVIFFAQFANGLLLPVIAGFLLWAVNDRQLMKEHSNNLGTNVCGFLVLAITVLLGAKGMWSSLQS